MERQPYFTDLDYLLGRIQYKCYLCGIALTAEYVEKRRHDKSYRSFQPICGACWQKVSNRFDHRPERRVPIKNPVRLFLKTLGRYKPKGATASSPVVDNRPRYEGADARREIRTIEVLEATEVDVEKIRMSTFKTEEERKREKEISWKRFVALPLLERNRQLWRRVIVKVGRTSAPSIEELPAVKTATRYGLRKPEMLKVRCAGCGVMFYTTDPRQKYHDKWCQKATWKRRRSSK